MSAVIPRTKSKGTNVEYTGTDDMPGIDWGDGGKEGEREGGREKEGGRKEEKEKEMRGREKTFKTTCTCWFINRHLATKTVSTLSLFTSFQHVHFPISLVHSESLPPSLPPSLSHLQNDQNQEIKVSNPQELF